MSVEKTLYKLSVNGKDSVVQAENMLACKSHALASVAFKAVKAKPEDVMAFMSAGGKVVEVGNAPADE